MKNYTLLDLATFADDRGSLTVLDNVLPFPVVRTYWIYGADSQVRGGHRHYVTRQALVAISGEVSIFMDDGMGKSTVLLNKPSLCLLVEPKDWHTMTFGKDSILLVMSSHHYDRSDYNDTPYDN
jgi:hypothetical protein